MRIRIALVSLCLLVALLASATVAAESAGTIVRITDKVLVEDTIPLGMHMAGMVKKRCVEENFEGTFYRQIHRVDVQDDGSLLGLRLDQQWVDLLEGASYTVLSGPDRWKTGTVRALKADPSTADQRGRARVRIVLDEPFRAHPKENAVLLEKRAMEEGMPVGFASRNWYRRNDWSQTERVSNQNEYVHDDLPPGSFGTTAMNLRGAQQPAHLSFHAMDNSSAGTNGEWHVRFWAKAKKGRPKLEVAVTGAEKAHLEPGDEWWHYEQRFPVHQDPEPDRVEARFDVTGGDMLIDDVEVWIEGDTNPTPFRDDMVEVLQEYNPGVMRMLHNDANTMPNSIAPPIEAYGTRGIPFGKVKRREVSIHEFYQLCEHLGADAWATLPGTITPRDMEVFMEFIGAPSDTGYGQKRAQWGQEKPWTEALENIYVQIGNEVITFPGVGYPGPGYWKDLITRAKESPYYRPNVHFVVNKQTGARRVLGNTPNADMLCLGNYLMYSLRQEELDTVLNTRDALFRYVFAWPYYKWTERDVDDVHAARDFGVDVSIYEGGNYHLTFGDAPSEVFNDIINGIGGQVNVTNSELFILKRYGIRVQNKFNLSQFNFRGGGSFGSGVSVRLWGHVINMRKGKRRYRPGFLADRVCNQVIGGDLVETVHEGAAPTFEATGGFTWNWSNKEPEPTTVGGVPVLYSYAFTEGDRRGLIITSLDTSKERPVEIQFEGEVAGGKATQWLLTADEITANNEPEVGEPQVQVRESTVEGFRSGYAFDMPPFSLIAFEWHVE